MEDLCSTVVRNNQEGKKENKRKKVRGGEKGRRKRLIYYIKSYLVIYSRMYVMSQNKCRKGGR